MEFPLGWLKCRELHGQNIHTLYQESSENDCRQLIKDLALRSPPYDEQYRDSVPINIKPLSNTHRADPNSSKALPLKLDTLPPELQSEILKLLDFNNLGNVRLAGYRIKCILEDMLAFRNMTTHASNVLRALKLEGLGGIHSLESLNNSTLR